MDAFYDRFGKIVFGKGYSDKDVSPTVEEVKSRYGEDTAELYCRSLERELTSVDIAFAMNSDEENEPLKPLRGWNVEHMDGASAFFIRDLRIDYFGGKNA